MKNIVLAIMTFCLIVAAGTIYQTQNEVNHYKAQCVLNDSEAEVKSAFKDLTNAWGDHAEIDTIVTNNQWQLIQKGDMEVDDMIAMAKSVKSEYEVDGYGDYSYMTNDEKFDQAVQLYEDARKHLDEND